MAQVIPFPAPAPAACRLVGERVAHAPSGRVGVVTGALPDGTLHLWCAGGITLAVRLHEVARLAPPTASA